MHEFIATYATDRKPIHADSQELRFMKALCAGDAEGAAALFADKVQFRDEPPAVDAPHGRFEGREAIRDFAGNWLASFGADRAEFTPVVQTIAGGRAAIEGVASFYREGALLREIPMITVGDLRPHGQMDGARIYFHFKQAPGFSAYRAPIFKSQHLTAQEPHLLTGSPRAYLEALHHEPKCDVDKVIEIVGPKCCFGGYITDQGIILCDKAELRKAYERMSEYIPRWLNIRFETVIDDGISCVIEWVHVITKDGREEGNRLCESGVAVYERDEEGYLGAIRICDYAHCENLIDWEKERLTKAEAERINYLG